MNKKVIIIGATSGIGKALAFEYAKQGYILGLTGRRTEVLEKLKKELPCTVYTQYMDVLKPEEAQKNLEELIKKMDGMDTIIISSGIGTASTEPDWSAEKDVIATNVTGFTAIAVNAAAYFCEKGRGHIVGISSIAGKFYHASSSSYPASKAFVSTYLKGLRVKINNLVGKNKIFITDIRPGYIDTPMVAHIKYKPFMISAPEVARLIYKAVDKRKRVAYVPQIARFGAYLLAFCLKFLPFITEKFLK
jgi:short-subunit dehydrogenase